MAPQLAWLGLGNMGRGMCKNLVEKGNLSSPLIIFNRTQKRADDLATKLGKDKTKVASTVEEAVEEADIIFTCLGDDKSIIDTIDAALKTDVKGKLFVDCTTVHPDTTNALAERIKASGAEFVACPVFGPPAMADNGQLVCVLAGPASAVDKAKPYTVGVMSRANIDLSDEPYGKATLLKVIGNSFILSMVETISEGHTIAEKTGLGCDKIQMFIETFFPGIYLGYSGRMLSGDYYKREEPFFAVDLARKDARHGMALAKEAGCHMKILEVVDKHLATVQNEMGERGDISSIYGAVRMEGGLPFNN